jgi:glycosyl transferase family 87
MNPRTFAGPSRALLHAVFACLVLSAGAQWLLHGVYQFVVTDWTRSLRFDAAVDWAAARLFWRGISPYSPEGLAFVDVPSFGHPPTTSFWFLPLAQFDLTTFAHMMGLLNFGLLLALVALVVFKLRFPLPYIATAAIFGFMQDSPATLDHNHIVQLSVVIAFGIVLSWAWLRDGEDLKGGILLGLICTLKPFPCVILFLLLCLGRFRAVAAAAASFLAVAAVMTWRYGLDSWALFLEQQKPTAAYWMGDVRNASLQGVLRRTLRERCGIIELDPGLVNLFTLSACAALLALCTWVALRALRRRPGRATFDRAYALFGALSAFLNPWIWHHYVFILLFPVLVAAHALADHYVARFKDWSVAAVSHVRQLGNTALTGLGLLPLWAAAQWSQTTLNATARSTINYCRHQGSAEVKAWLLQRAELLEATSWLPWLIAIVVLTALLFFPRAAGSAVTRATIP